MRVRTTAKWLGLTGAPLILATAILSGQTQQSGPQSVFRAATNTVSTDIIVRGRDGRFVPDLRLDEFTVFEDGIQQRITNFVSVIGGRATSRLLASAPAVAPGVAEGLVLPRSIPKSDESGRIFIIFIDDLHLTAQNTPKVRAVLKMIRDTVVHENDLVGFVSSGYSSIQINPSYDYGHRRFDEAISKVIGSGPSVPDLLAAMDNVQGPVGIRHDVHVAFSAAYGILRQAAQITNRRKSFIYVSSGYHFDPFKDERLRIANELYDGGLSKDTNNDGTIDDEEDAVRLPHESLTEGDAANARLFAEADLTAELAELVRAANRANTTFYTVDPRGLLSGDDISVNRTLAYAEWRDYHATQITSLKTIAEGTGGFATVDNNDFISAFKRIDNETSDYYILGYTSNNPDPKKVRRSIKIEVSRPGTDSFYRPDYTLPPLPRRAPPARSPASGPK